MRKRKKQFVITFIGVTIAAGVAGGEEPVYFADPNLKAVVEHTLWAWDPTPSDMLQLTSLHAPAKGIADVTGLEYAACLTDADLSHNHIADISPLSGLSGLRTLRLNSNQIGDLSPLSELRNLQTLDLHDNRIDDISPLAGLGALHELMLRSNEISDISPLQTLHDLQVLVLRWNQISDISVLADLANLRELDLCANRITNIASLVRLTNLEELALDWNYRLNENAYCSHLQMIVDNNPLIELSYRPNLKPPAGVSASDGTYGDKVVVSWGQVCNGPNYTSRYRVFRAVSPEGEKTPVSDWLTSQSFDDRTAEAGTVYTYWVQTGTFSAGANTGSYSKPDGGWARPVLVISSTAGGSVITPCEGTHAVDVGQVIDVQAQPTDSNLYSFVGWTGTAVEAGAVADAGAAATTVTVDGTHTLRANFATWMSEIHVDDDAPDDPGSQDAGAGDPQENGTAAHPFDSIQEALEVAVDGASILVRPGTYHENIDFSGKRIQLLGIDANNPSEADYPVIDGAGQGPVVTFAGGEDPNCVLMGFVLTGGVGGPAGAIRCSRSSPTILNCLIVGNRATDRNGAAVYCTDSNAVFVNCTIADNAGGQEGGGLFLEDGGVIVTNSILWGNTPRAILVAGAGEPSITYSDVAGGWPGPGNIEADPLFVRPGAWDPNGTPYDPTDDVWLGGDYHLQSQAGRWDGQAQAWVRDGATSPCIDAGDPARPVGDEPVPHGETINAGAYGGTISASQSP